MNHEDVGRSTEQGERREIGYGIVAELAVERRADREAVGGLEDGVAIGRCLR